MPPKKTAKGHVKCDPIPVGTIYKGTNKREVIVGKEFAQGGFGRICDAKLVGKSEKLIIKLEPSGNGPLFTEMHVFQRILRSDMLEAYKKKQKLSHLGLPYLVESGMQEEIRFLVMPKFSFCLDHIVKESRTPLKLENVTDILGCVCNALKYMHENDYVHADIKAANIMMNKKNAFNEVYLIDFGLARKVGTLVEKEDKKKAHDGTALFTSTDAHRGCGFTFRGDVEILGHNALFWLTKTLPWKDIFDEDATIKMKNEQLGEVRAAKESLLSNLTSNLKKFVSDSSSAAVVQMLYKASKIDINTKPDFDDVLKSLSNVNKGKKKAVESDSETAPQPSTARRGRKPVVQDDDDAEVVPASATRTSRKKKSDSDIEELDPPARRKAKITTKKDEEPTPVATKSRRGKGSASDSEIPSSSAKSRTRQTSENGIIPGLTIKMAGRAAMPSHQEESEEEEENEDEPIPPPKSTRRYPATPKIPTRSKVETPQLTSSAKSRILSHEALPVSTPPARKYPYVDSSPPKPIKKPAFSQDCKALNANSQPKKLPTSPTKKSDLSQDFKALTDNSQYTKFPTPPIKKPVYVDSSPPKPIKKPAVNQEYKTPTYNSQLKKLPTPQPSASQLRTRSNDQKLFSPRIPSASNYDQYYKSTEPKPKTPLVKRRSRSFENSPPPVSPEFRIQEIPQPQGCNII